MHTEYQLKNLKGELHMDGRKVLKRYFEENRLRGEKLDSGVRTVMKAIMNLRVP